jgi:hypothetical protein
VGWEFVKFVTLFLILVRVQRFNKQKAPPDVQKEEWNACMSPEPTEIGSPMRGEKLYDFLQKQADLIRFLKEHNAKLGEKLMVLSAQMQARGWCVKEEYIFLWYNLLVLLTWF